MLTLKNCRVQHHVSAAIALIAIFLMGLTSALNIVFLANQDSVWGFPLLISGVLFCLLAIIYGANKFRLKIVNEFGHRDWNLPRIWVVIVVCIFPALGTVFVLWNVVDNILGSPSWSSLSLDSFLVVIIEWLILLALLIILNIIIVKCRLNFFQMDSGQGYNPYRLEEIPPYENDLILDLEVELSESRSKGSESVKEF
ncbi:unnamed protein product [Dibothriocephalus latus]|uniref:Transmembrane protein n=1 Tax=Dibothriocephalus latus TaxID=60516 RepID=A0A3P6U7W6_DIBLA|nr:unnamed protein product [Dibothriocephalus latus]